MEPAVRKVGTDTWIFEEEGVRFFLLTGSKSALLIDSGMRTRNARNLAMQYTDLPLSLLNTHGDPDHVGSNAQFSHFYMHPAELLNYYKLHHGTGRIDPVLDNTVIDLGDRPLLIRCIPGHTPGSVCILDRKYRRLYSGDTVQDGTIFMFGPQRDMHLYLESLHTLQHIQGDIDEIWPSHGTCPVKPALVSELARAAQSILNHELPGTPGEMFGNPVSVIHAGPAVFLCDAAQEAAEPPKVKENSMLDWMQSRRSIRRYQDQPIPREQIEKVLQAGLLSPSGRDRKPWEFLVVQDREMLRKMSRCRAGAAAMLEGAGCAIVVLGKKDADTAVEDCSIAMTQMHLMAHSLGLGSSWIQIRMRNALDGTPSETVLRDLLGFPETMQAEAVLSLGVPAEHPAAHPLPDPKDARIHWELWDSLVR